MKVLRHELVGLAAAWAIAPGTLAVPTGVPAGSQAVEFTFTVPPVNSLGIRSMSELRGKPVLIDFWGTR